MEAAEEYKTGEREAGKKFAQKARDYVLLLRQHITKEDHILYPLTDRHLSEEKQKELLQLFEKLEEERMGGGKHEEYHGLVH